MFPSVFALSTDHRGSTSIAANSRFRSDRLSVGEPHSIGGEKRRTCVVAQNHRLDFARRERDLTLSLEVAAPYQKVTRVAYSFFHVVAHGVGISGPYTRVFSS